MTAATMSSSPLRSKKRKHHPSTPEGLPQKKSKKERRKHSDVAEIPEATKSTFPVKSMGKEKPIQTDKNEFVMVTASLMVAIPPVFERNPRAGVEEMLDSLVMKHVPALRGVLLAHSNIEFVQDNAVIQADCPFAITEVVFDATVWSPRIGMRLSAKVNLFSPDHISLIVHRTFNVSIPRNHIPTDEYEFEYGPAENDPEFGAGVVTEFQMDIDEQVPPTTEHIESVGKWVRRTTGEKVGYDDGSIEFTIIGLTMVNQMISIIGSLQPDPFSSEHLITASTAPAGPIPSKRTRRDDTSASETEALDRPFSSLSRRTDMKMDSDDEPLDMFDALDNLRKKEEDRERKRLRKEAKAKRKAESMTTNDNGVSEKKERKKKKRKVQEE